MVENLQSIAVSLDAAEVAEISALDKGRRYNGGSLLFCCPGVVAAAAVVVAIAATASTVFLQCPGCLSKIPTPLCFVGSSFLLAWATDAAVFWLGLLCSCVHRRSWCVLRGGIQDLLPDLRMNGRLLDSAVLRVRCSALAPANHRHLCRGRTRHDAWVMHLSPRFTFMCSCFCAWCFADAGALWPLATEAKPQT